ncbi:MAG: Gldg family protein [bacterium]|nr:Gldg family protein [bacterium]
MRESSPLTLTRADIGQWVGFLGGAALLIALLGLIWQQGFSPFILIAFGIGVVGVLLWALLAPSEFMAFVTGRQARYSTVALFSTLLLLGIVVLVYILLQRSALTADLTEGRRFTLSETTLEIVSRVQRPMRIVGFYSPRTLEQRTVDDQFFRLYETASNGLITREYIDPVAQPTIAERFNVVNDGDVFVTFLNINGESDAAAAQYVPRTTRQERDMTEAISRLLLGGNYVIYFDNSLDQLSPQDTSQQGISSIVSLIREYGLVALPLNLQDLVEAGQPIPQDASALVMARPSSDPTPEMIALIDEYMARGGALFLTADVQSNFMRPGSAFNEYIWQNYGLRMLDAVVVDEVASAETQLDIYPAITADSEITASITVENPTNFSIARAIEVNTSPPVSNGWAIQSSEASYGETDLITLLQNDTWAYNEGVDIPGPLTTVAWARNESNGASVLLVGDSSFLTNGLIGNPAGNAALFSSGLLWMSGAGEAVTFTPEPTITGQPIIFTDARTLDFIAAVTGLVMPGIMLVLGGLVWYHRSRR